MQTLNSVLNTAGFIISFERPNLTELDKVQRLTELLGAFKGVVALTGSWDGVEESSFFVPASSNPQALVISMAKQWNQDAVLFNVPQQKKAFIIPVCQGVEDGVLELFNLELISKREAGQQLGFTRLFTNNQFYYMACLDK